MDKWFSEKNKQVNRVTACWESHPEPLNEEKNIIYIDQDIKLDEVGSWFDEIN